MQQITKDLLTMAAESRAIRYWADITDSQRELARPGYYTSLTIVDGGFENDPVKTNPMALTEAVLFQARDALVSGKVKVRKDLAAQFVSAPDQWDCDEEGLDVLIQAAYFGKLVYG